MRLRLHILNSLVQGCYWIFYAALLSFASVFLLGRGYSNSAIGVILAAGNALAIVLQPLISNTSDRLQNMSLPSFMMIPAGILVMLTGAELFLRMPSPLLSVLAVTIIGILMGIQPLINGFSFYLERSGYTVNFGLCRAIGGGLLYATGTSVIGFLSQSKGPDAVPVIGALSMGLFILILLFTASAMKQALSQEKNAVRASDIRQITFMEFLRGNRFYFLFSLGIAGIYFGHSVQNTFTIQMVTDVGGTSSNMGTLLTFMAICELPGLSLYSLINRKISTAALLKISMTGFMIKIILVYLAKNMFMLYVAHFFQLIGLGLFLPAIVTFVQEVMEPGEVLRGQSVYTLMIVASTVISSLVGGVIIDTFGIKRLLFICILFTAAGCAIIIALAGKIRRKETEQEQA